MGATQAETVLNINSTNKTAEIDIVVKTNNLEVQ